MKPIFNFSCIVCVRGRSGFWLMFDISANLISYRNVRSHDSYFHRPTIIACLHDSRDYLFYTYSFWEVPFSMVNVYVCMRSCHTAFIASVNNNWTFLCVRSMQISSFYMFKWNWNSFFMYIFSLNIWRMTFEMKHDTDFFGTRLFNRLKLSFPSKTQKKKIIK